MEAVKELTKPRLGQAIEATAKMVKCRHGTNPVRTTWVREELVPPVRGIYVGSRTCFECITHYEELDDGSWYPCPVQQAAVPVWLLAFGDRRKHLAVPPDAVAIAE